MPMYDNIDEALKSKADSLVKILRQRMQQLMNSRNVDKNRREHWVIRVAYKNLAVVAAYMVLLDHVKHDVLRVDETISLLSINTNNFVDFTIINTQTIAHQPPWRGLEWPVMRVLTVVVVVEVAVVVVVVEDSR